MNISSESKKKYEKYSETSTKIRCQDENEAKMNNEIIAEIKIFFKEKID